MTIVMNEAKVEPHKIYNKQVSYSNIGCDIDCEQEIITYNYIAVKLKYTDERRRAPMG